MKKHLIGITLMLLSSTCFAQYLKKDKAIEDLNEFKTLMEIESSYYQLSDFDFSSRYKFIEQEIRLHDSIPIYFLAYELEKIISETIDRHASIKMKNFEADDFEQLNLYFPFALSSLDGDIVALKEKNSNGEYEYYSKKYPFVKSIN